MSRYDHNMIVEVYALLDHSNETYMGLNQVLAHFRYSIIKMRVDEFERKFRDYFKLKAFTTQRQDRTLTVTNSENQSENIFITEELFDLLELEFSTESHFLKNGYVFLLKKSFMFFEDETESLMKKIKGFKAVTDEFIASFNRGMCIAGYRHFQARSSFIRIPSLKKTVVKKTMSQSQPVYSPISFSKRDRYFVKLYLLFEEKQQKHTKKAVQLFCNSVNLKENKQKFFGLTSSLEICFQYNQSLEFTPQQYAKYVFALCYEYRSSFENLYESFSRIFELRQSLNNSVAEHMAADSDFTNKIVWLENILGEVIRKLIRLNHLNLEGLIENLERRFLTMKKLPHNSQS